MTKVYKSRPYYACVFCSEPSTHVGFLEATQTHYTRVKDEHSCNVKVGFCAKHKSKGHSIMPIKEPT